ncbi:hypothetical protein Y1Q_0022784 [Alligator mississippiensis]|uniref:Uncharacterized protein n=1 Tax=Alligator mississippiensis TaxID=8496 RepID=A0A151N4H4_ALLMI|nr:hypothetical protein Y1Q_0022784 [Alligator mississippiensis]
MHGGAAAGSRRLAEAGGSHGNESFPGRLPSPAVNRGRVKAVCCSLLYPLPSIVRVSFLVPDKLQLAGD